MKSTATTEVLMARHCMTEWNELGLLQGTVDKSLSPKGVAQAENVAATLDELGITRVITSPLRRAAETGAIYAQHLQIPRTEEPGLRELDHGDWEGSSLAELRSRDEVFRSWLANPAKVPIPEGSETVQEAQHRACTAIRTIHDNQPGERVLVVSHKHLISLLRCALRGIGLEHFSSEIVEEAQPWPIPASQLAQLPRGS